MVPVIKGENMISEKILNSIIDSKKITKILYEFEIMWVGWEIDSKGWIVQCDDNTKRIVMTNHCTPYFATENDLISKIKDYQGAIDNTKKAIEILLD